MESWRETTTVPRGQDMADSSAGGVEGGMGDTVTARSRRLGGSKPRVQKDSAIPAQQQQQQHTGRRVDKGTRNRHQRKMSPEIFAAAVATSGSDRTASGTFISSGAFRRDGRGVRPVSGGGLWSGSNFPRATSEKPRFGMVAQQNNRQYHGQFDQTASEVLPQSLAAAAAALRIPRARVIRRQDSENLAVLSSDGGSSCSAETDDDYDYEDEDEEREFSRLGRVPRLARRSSDGESYFGQTSDDPSSVGTESTLPASDAACATCAVGGVGGEGGVDKPGSQGTVGAGTRVQEAESGFAAGEDGPLVSFCILKTV